MAIETKHKLYYDWPSRFSNYREVTPTGKWEVVNNAAGTEPRLYLEVQVNSVQGEHDIEPFMAYEDRLRLVIVTTNQCNTLETKG